MKNKIIIVCLIIGAVAAAGYVAYLSVWTGMTVKKIIIYSPFPIRYNAQEITGKKLFFVNEEALRRQILEKNQEVKTVVIEKQYPDSLKLTVVVRQPIAQLQSSSSPRYIDEDGVVLSQGITAIGLPVIEAWGVPLYWSGKADWRLTKAVLLIQLLEKEHIPLQRIVTNESGSAYVVTGADNLQVYVPYTANPGAVVASLQVILSRFRIEGKRLAAVDFRYDKPVVTFQTGEKISPL